MKRKYLIDAFDFFYGTIEYFSFFLGPYFVKAKTALQGMQVLNPTLQVEVVEHPDRDTFRAWWGKQREVSNVRKKFPPRTRNTILLTNFINFTHNFMLFVVFY